jgi:hypothetical protein
MAMPPAARSAVDMSEESYSVFKNLTVNCILCNAISRYKITGIWSNFLLSGKAGIRTNLQVFPDLAILGNVYPRPGLSSGEKKPEG